MAINVKFIATTQAKFDALAAKDAGTFYRVAQTGGTEDFYIGSTKLNNQAEVTAAIAALDADVSASGTAEHGGTFVVTGITEVDGVITAVASQEVESAGAAAAAIASLNGTALVASKTGNIITLSGQVKEVEGIISKDTTVADITLAAISATGASSDASYDNTTSGLTATDVQAAIDEVAAASAGGVDSKTIYMTDNTSTTGTDYAAIYKIYQGSEGSAASPEASELIGTINIPKDQFLDDQDLVTITFDNGHLYDGATDVTEIIKGAGGTATADDAGKYIKLVFALPNAKSTTYLAVNDLVDVYTAEANASQIQLAIDANNVISAEIVDSSVDSDALGTDAVITAKIADGNVTKAKLAQTVQDSLDLADSAVQTVAEGSTNGSIAVDGVDISVHGLDTAAYQPSSAFDAAGSASQVQQNLEAALTWTDLD